MGFFISLKYLLVDGITAAKKISEIIKEKRIPFIPIIACTAFSSKNDIENCF